MVSFLLVKAILKFDLPEEQAEHSYALAGLDALLLIEDLLSEIRSKLKYNSGPFQGWKDEEGVALTADDATLDKVRELIVNMKAQRNLPEIL